MFHLMVEQSIFFIRCSMLHLMVEQSIFFYKSKDGPSLENCILCLHNSETFHIKKRKSKNQFDAIQYLIVYYSYE